MKTYKINTKKEIINRQPTTRDLYQVYLEDQEAIKELNYLDMIADIVQSFWEDYSYDDLTFQDYLWKRDGNEAVA